MTKTIVEVSPGPSLPTTFTALISQPQKPSPSTMPPVAVVEIETSAELIPGPVGPQGPQGDTGPQGPQGSPDTGADILAKLLPVDGAGSGLDADLLDAQHGSFYLDWNNQTNKPATFPPSTHTHPQSDVTNLVSDLALKAPLASPGLTGTPSAPTAAPGTNTTQIATTAFSAAAIAAQAATQLTKDNAQDAAITLRLTDAPSDGLTYGRKNAAWSTIVGGAVVSDTPPPGPLQAGQLWWESDSGNLYLYYTDANSSQWVQVNVANTGPTGRIIERVLTTSGTYTKPVGLVALRIRLVGGGGGGNYGRSAASQSSGGSGGGGGGYAESVVPAASVPSSVAYTIGAGGAGGNGTTPSAPTGGGATSFGSLTAASGGAIGVAVATSGVAWTMRGGLSGGGTTGDFLIPGDHGGPALSILPTGNAGLGGNGGSSKLGQGGITGYANVDGGGGGYGGGGGGAFASAGQNVNGGGGGQGVIILEEFY